MFLDPIPGRGGRGATISLDGLWDFSFAGSTARLEGEDHRIRSPGVWQAQFPALRGACGTGRYRRRVEIPEDWRGRVIALVMEGVFHEATILVDGKPIASHGDGWTTIDVDLTAALDGKTSFTLGIDARVPDDRDAGRGRLADTLAGKQDWYGVQGGIWKPARLEARDFLHVADLTIRTECDCQSGVVFVSGVTSRDPADARLRVTVSRAGATMARQDFALTSRAFAVSLSLAAPDLWSPDAPNLHDVDVALLAGGQVVDAIGRAVGFRRIEARDGRILLNGRPLTLIGALDQDWHPQEECRPPSAEFLEERFRNAKAMGLNTLRCHVKIPDRLYFDLADRLGLIVWLDMPYAQFLAPTTRETLRRVFRRSVVEHGSHPSICIWTLFNEGWGIDLDDNPDDRRWLIETFDEAKALARGSLVVDNSPCFPRNYHLKTDIEDFHWYNGFPHQNDAFAATAREFALRAPWTWSPHGDAISQGDEPLICSEFGVWGLPHPRDILEPDGAEPWWFESGHDWNLGAAYPHGIATRFRDAQLAPIFGDLDRFVDAAQEFQFRSLKFQIETLRWERAISGYVITELNDVQWESNGLMDVRNRPRRFADRLAELHTHWLAIAQTSRSAIAVGERLEVSLRLAGAGELPPGATLTWRFADQSGRVGATIEPTNIVIEGFACDRVTTRTLELEAHDAAGRLLSRNRLEICVVPKLAGAVPALHAIDVGAQAILAALHWPKATVSADAADMILATRLTTPVRERLLAGQNALLIGNSVDALVDPMRELPASDRHNFPSMEIQRRDGQPWDGRWMGAFTWRRMDGPWAGLPNGPMLDEHWRGLIPGFVLTAFLSTAFGGLVDSGVCVGWLHLAAAFVKRSRLGPGWLTTATFDLSSSEAARNPLAPHLLLALAKS